MSTPLRYLAASGCVAPLDNHDSYSSTLRIAFPRKFAIRARKLAPYTGIARYAPRMRNGHCRYRSPPVPVEGPVQKTFTSEECCVHDSFCAGASVHDTDVAIMKDEHGIALFVLAKLAWYHRQACE